MDIKSVKLTCEAQEPRNSELRGSRETTVSSVSRFFTIILSLLIFTSVAYAQQTQLAIGDSATYTVQANKRINKTPLRMEQGAKYHFKAAGEWQDAGFKPSNADGFEGFTTAMQKGNFLKPVKKENYMKLIARIGGKKIGIGTAHTFIAPKTGRLVFIPNDATFFFGNNSGVLQVTVERIE